jgi:hypothetical protein
MSVPNPENPIIQQILIQISIVSLLLTDFLD